MRKESLFTADKLAAKRVYQSPAINVVKLGTMAILAGSDKPTTTNETLEEGNTSTWSF